jgi:hypothetical protein
MRALGVQARGQRPSTAALVLTASGSAGLTTWCVMKRKAEMVHCVGQCPLPVSAARSAESRLAMRPCSSLGLHAGCPLDNHGDSLVRSDSACHSEAIEETWKGNADKDRLCAEADIDDTVAGSAVNIAASISKPEAY